GRRRRRRPPGPRPAGGRAGRRRPAPTGGRPRRGVDRRPAGHRSPGCLGLPTRAHARLLRARGPHGCRLHRARRRQHQGRRARRPPRERDLRDDGHRRPAGVRRPPGHEGHRRRARDRLVHRGPHARRAAHPAGGRAPARRPRGEHPLQRPLPGADPRRGPRAEGAALPRAGPGGRRLRRDQAPHLLRPGRPVPGGAAAGRPGAGAPGPAELPGVHPVVRDLEPQGAGRRGRPGAPGAAAVGDRCALRPGGDGRPGDLRDPLERRGPAGDRDVRRRCGTGEGPGHPAQPRRDAGRADQPGRRRARRAAAGAPVHLPERERLPAVGAPRGGRAGRLRPGAGRARRVLGGRDRRDVQRQPRHRRPLPRAGADRRGAGRL
ncbi:MAG: Glycerophosphoryl diester phosphodiesterase, partial [uncultured Blastococcus sp.]